MTDIVERLRYPVNNWNSGGRFEAADEIERLRNLLKEWDEPGACGCDTFTCMGTCLAARTHDAAETKE